MPGLAKQVPRVQAGGREAGGLSGGRQVVRNTLSRKHSCCQTPGAGVCFQQVVFICDTTAQVFIQTIVQQLIHLILKLEKFCSEKLQNIFQLSTM